jgi:hypothetical protein
LGGGEDLINEEDLIMGLFSGQDMDPVLLGSMAAIGISAVVAIYLGLKLRKLMNESKVSTLAFGL